MALVGGKLENPVAARLVVERILEGAVGNFRYYLEELKRCGGPRCVEIVKDAANHISDIGLARVIIEAARGAGCAAGVSDVVHDIARCIRVKAYEVEDVNIAWGLHSLYKAFYASLRGDVRSAAFLTFASYAFLTERRELAWAVLREVLGERRVEQEKLLLELGRLLHGFKKAGVVITSKDVERD